ncbi:MAG: GNAT family N-acetyltransferase [Oscillospiraceae bacterium]|nr:GNAT family N-acetyltransferase [Oscillospiraceae bacterium]
MTIRSLTHNDLPAHCGVMSMAYHCKCNPEEASLPKNATVLGCFSEEGVLVAALTYARREAAWGKAALPIVCVGGVASLPHHRHGGAVRMLFGELERLARQEGWAFGALYPFSDSYYRQFGYERASRYLQLDVPMRAVVDFAKSQPKELPNEAAGQMELMEGEASGELLRVYNAYAAGIPLMLRRGREHADRFYTKPLEDCRYCFLWRNGSSGAAEGMLQCELDAENRVLMVRELAWLSPAALRGMLRFMRGYASKADTVRFCALPMGSPVPLLFNEYCENRVQVMNGAMLRIYDAARVLEGFPAVGDGVKLSPEALVLLVSGQLRNALSLRCLPGVEISSEEEARALAEAFRHCGVPLIWDGF